MVLQKEGQQWSFTAVLDQDIKKVFDKKKKK